MAKYRKKPIEVEAFQLGSGEMPEWLASRIHNGHMEEGEIAIYEDHYLVYTMEGLVRTYDGNWIIQDVQKEIYVCKSDIFDATYESVRDKVPEELFKMLEEFNRIYYGLKNAAPQEKFKEFVNFNFNCYKELPDINTKELFNCFEIGYEKAE